jgi:hypothetical protein
MFRDPNNISTKELKQCESFVELFIFLRSMRNTRLVKFGRHPIFIVFVCYTSQFQRLAVRIEQV